MTTGFYPAGGDAPAPSSLNTKSLARVAAMNVDAGSRGSPSRTSIVVLSAVIGVLSLLILAAASGVLGLWQVNVSLDVTAETGEVDWEIIPNTTDIGDLCADNEPDLNLFPAGTPPFSPPYDFSASSPQQMDKDVGCAEFDVIDSDNDGDLDTIEITIFNAYPFYYVDGRFEARNTGTVPIIINTVSFDVGCDGVIDAGPYSELNATEVEQHGVQLELDGDADGPEIIIWWGDNFGEQLHPLESADLGFNFVLLEEASEGASYNICIYLDAVQWNEYGG